MTKPSNVSKIDAALQLSLKAALAGDHEGAAAQLTELLQRVPGHPMATYLLAAELGQLNQFDQAVFGMHEALQSDPTLHIARFQLGLLFLTHEQNAAAAACFTHLVGVLPREVALAAFAAGLLALIKDDVVSARAELERGLALNHEIPALNADMRQVLTRLDAVTGGPIAAAIPQPNQVYLARYQTKDED